MAREAHEHDPPITEIHDERAEEVLAERLGEELKHLIEIVHFGHDTELFLEGKASPEAAGRVARYVVDKAQHDLTEATRQLLDMNSLSDTKAAEAHMKARVAVSILRWLDEATTAGREAELAIQGLDAP